MRPPPQIVALYEEADRGFDNDRQAALTVGDQVGTQRIEQKQLIGDQAHFVLCWGRLEAEIDAACRAAIGRRKADQSWEMRRGFDFYDPTDRRLSGLPRRRARGARAGPAPASAKHGTRCPADRQGDRGPEQRFPPAGADHRRRAGAGSARPGGGSARCFPAHLRAASQRQPDHLTVAETLCGQCWLGSGGRK